MAQYERMAVLMAKIKGKAILSLNDHPDIRRVFAAFELQFTHIKYCVGGGVNITERQELIIFSWDRRNYPVGLF